MKRMHQNDVELPAPVMAVLIDAGLATDWPHEWTRMGCRVLRRSKTWAGVMTEAGRHLRDPSGAARYPFMFDFPEAPLMCEAPEKL